MARPGVTYLNVANTAQQLIAAGKAPTVELVRIALGTGSNSTLGTHLRTWKTKQNQTQHIASKENLPEALIATLKGLWEWVMTQSDEKIQAVQQETKQDLEKYKQDIESLQQANTQWQQQHHKIKQERDSLAHEKSVLEQLLSEAKIDIATSNEKRVGFEQQIQENQARIDEWRHQNKQIQANLEHFRQASQEQRVAEQHRYEQQQKQLEQTIQQINQEVAEVKREKTVLQQSHQQAHFENNSLTSQIDKLTAQHDIMAANLTDAITDLAKRTQDQQHWQRQYEALQIKQDQQNQLFIELQSTYAVTSQQLSTIQAELQETWEQNKTIAHEKWILGQEKAQLYGQLKQLESIG